MLNEMRHFVKKDSLSWSVQALANRPGWTTHPQTRCFPKCIGKYRIGSPSQAISRRAQFFRPSRALVSPPRIAAPARPPSEPRESDR
jgi:hypothetical protein